MRRQDDIAGFNEKIKNVNEKIQTYKILMRRVADLEKSKTIEDVIRQIKNFEQEYSFDSIMWKDPVLAKIKTAMEKYWLPKIELVHQIDRRFKKDDIEKRIEANLQKRKYAEEYAQRGHQAMFEREIAEMRREALWDRRHAPDWMGDLMGGLMADIFGGEAIDYKTTMTETMNPDLMTADIRIDSLLGTMPGFLETLKTVHQQDIQTHQKFRQLFPELQNAIHRLEGQRSQLIKGLAAEIAERAQGQMLEIKTSRDPISGGISLCLKFPNFEIGMFIIESIHQMIGLKVLEGPNAKFGHGKSDTYYIPLNLMMRIDGTNMTEEEMVLRRAQLTVDYVQAIKALLGEHAPLINLNEKGEIECGYLKDLKTPLELSPDIFEQLQKQDKETSVQTIMQGLGLTIRPPALKGQETFREAVKAVAGKKEAPRPSQQTPLEIPPAKHGKTVLDVNTFLRETIGRDFAGKSSHVHGVDEKKEKKGAQPAEPPKKKGP
jgi:hypothetical protein